MSCGSARGPTTRSRPCAGACPPTESTRSWPPACSSAARGATSRDCCGSRRARSRTSRGSRASCGRPPPRPASPALLVVLLPLGGALLAELASPGYLRGLAGSLLTALARRPCRSRCRRLAAVADPPARARARRERAARASSPRRSEWGPGRCCCRSRRGAAGCARRAPGARAWPAAAPERVPAPESWPRASPPRARPARPGRARRDGDQARGGARRRSARRCRWARPRRAGSGWPRSRSGARGRLPGTRSLAGAPRSGQRREPCDASCPALLDLLRVSVESGLSLGCAGGGGRADQRAAGARVARGGAEAQLGVPLARSLDGLAHRAPLPEVHALVAALERAGRHGAPLAETLASQARGARPRSPARDQGARGPRRAEDPARGGAAARAVGAAAGRRGARCRRSRGRRTPDLAARTVAAAPRKLQPALAEATPARARPQVGPPGRHPPDWQDSAARAGTLGVVAGPPWAIWTARWRYVLQSGGKWGTVASHSRTGVAGLLPLRHFGPNSSSELHEHWLSAATSTTRSTLRTGSTCRPSSGRPSPSGVVLAKALEPCVAIWTPEAFEQPHERLLAGLNPLSERAAQAHALLRGRLVRRSSSTRPGG